MPSSPKVGFEFVNNNIEVSKPLNGVSCIIARTTNGPVGLGDELINSVPKFRNTYGSEIVPNGSPSNIEKALKGGSKLRIIRVVGAGATSNFAATTNNAAAADTIFNIGFINGTFTSTEQNIQFRFKAKNSQAEFNSYKQVMLKVLADGANIYTITYSGNVVLERKLLFTVDFDPESDTLIFDYDSLNNWIQTNKYWDIYWLSAGASFTALGVPTSEAKGGDLMVQFFKNNIDGISTEGNTDLTVNIRTGATITGTLLDTGTHGGSMTGQTTNYTEAYVIKGSQGSTPTLQNWKDAADGIRDLQEIYEASCSHIDQHLSESDALQLHKYLADIANQYEEFQYFVEIPVVDGNTKSDILTKVAQYKGTIGKSKYVCYFSGGIKYYGDTGNLVDSNVMGTIHGLADACASNYGPYRSFAGLNRGIITDGYGPVVPNYGTPSRYDDLNELAEACVNMIVMKQTRINGLATCLWHSFTSQTKQDSFRFIHAVRLALYIKKQLRPILESYIEEPNIWTSWKRIYLEGKPIMDALVTDDAISEYSWDGDQDATAWDELTVNNEADARSGKYKLIIKVKDVATMQDIQVQLVYEQASNTVSSSITSV